MTIEVADRLVKLRKKYGYSQEELADKLGLSRQAVSKWERAEASPDTDNLICLAKLYGVSLDELLATDEDIDTIVKEQVKEQDKKEEEIETEDRTAETSRKENIVINKKGIFIQDKDGSGVTIDKHGINCHDGDKVVVKHHEHDRVMDIIGAVEGALFVVAIAAYIVLGVLFQLWDCAWVVFFVPEIPCSLARAIRKKNPNKFNMAFTACFAFFFVCMWLPKYIDIPQYWGVMWPVFLAIPVYHAISSAFMKIVKKDTDKDDDDEDDDEDDEDDDEKETVKKVDIDVTINK